MKKRSEIAVSLVSFILCLTGTFAASPVEPIPKHAVLGSWGINLANMDRAVKPGDDFFLHVNGSWFAKAVIPPDRTNTGSFEDLLILSENRMKEITAALDGKPYERLNDEEKKLRDLYDAFTDTKQINAAGLAPAQKDLRYFTSLQTQDDVARAMGAPDRGTDSLFDTQISPDEKDSKAYAVYISQSGLGMPDREYYLRDQKEIAATREAYANHLRTMLQMIGTADAEARANAVFKLETDIARIHWAAANRRDAEKTYNPVTITQLEQLAPGFPWRTLFAAEGIPLVTPKGERVLIARENTAFPGMAKIFANTPVAVWRDWLTLHYLHNMAAFLPESFDQADFSFYGQALSGQDRQLDRQTRAVRLLDRRLGHPLGKLYVARYFPPESKAKAESLVAGLIKAYDGDIRALSWMSDKTKEKALEKLHLFTPHIGYPEKWRDYSGLKILRDDLIGDVERSDLFEWRYRLDRIDQPVDRNEWHMTPPTINAYYTQNLNAIFFPAAILQPPFFDPDADDAVNYGGIGAVIGHEISHGFDDQGSKYTGTGLLQSWWTEEDRKAFEQRTAALASQFEAYEPLPGLHVNGKLTLGENIGDLSGLSIALKAYHLSLNGKPAPALDSFTGDQRFFLAWGQIWRSKYRDARMRQLVLSNPHSPPHFRVVGSTRNIDEWYDAFGVKPGDKYYLAPDKRVRLW